MQKYKISVIVPVYNSSEYIVECVESILGQTYKNLEVILVDDGSTDNSLEICNKLRSLDSRIVVLHQENAGPGAARNKGIEISTGEYIAFVDSDDTVAADMYEALAELAIKHGADLVCSSLNKNESEVCIKILDREEALYARIKTHDISDSSCDKLYRRDLFSKHKYPTDRSISEDSALIYRLVSESAVTVITNQKFYNIRQTNDSLSRCDYAPRFRFTVLTYEEMVEFFVASMEEKFVEIAQALAAGAVFFNAGEYYKYRCKDKETKAFIKAHAKKQLKSYRFLSSKNRALLWLIAHMFGLYGALYCVRGKRRGRK